MIIVKYSWISNVLLQLLIFAIIVKKLILNLHRIYKNAKETRREYETSNGVVDSSRGIKMVVTEAIL